jgi:hypothetical protein
VDLTTYTTRELLKLWAAIMRELLRRDVVRTANNPIGDIAEAVVTEHYDGQRQSFSNSGWDVTTPSGERLEVKGIRLTDSRTRANLSPIPATSTYTHVIIVVFDADLRITESLRMRRSAVERIFSPRKKDGARIIRLSTKLRNDVDVVPITISDELLDA